MSSSIFTYVNQSKDIYDIREEIAEFLTSVKINLGDMERLVAAFNNGTQIFSVDSVNLWEEILDCLVPIDNIISHIDFLYSNPISTHNLPQDTKGERTSEVILFLHEIPSRNSMELGTYLRKVIDLTSEALWHKLGKDNKDVFSLLLTLAAHPNDLLKTITAVVKASSALKSDNRGDLSKTLLFSTSLIQDVTHQQLREAVQSVLSSPERVNSCGLKSDNRGDLSKALLFSTSLIQDLTHQQLREAVQSVLSRIALMSQELLLNSSQKTHSLSTLFQHIFEIFINPTPGENTRSRKDEKTKEELVDFPDILKPLSHFQKYQKGLIALAGYWQKVSPIHPR